MLQSASQFYQVCPNDTNDMNIHTRQLPLSGVNVHICLSLHLSSPVPEAYNVDAILLPEKLLVPKIYLSKLLLYSSQHLYSCS